MPGLVEFIGTDKYLGYVQPQTMRQTVAEILNKSSHRRPIGVSVGAFGAGGYGMELDKSSREAANAPPSEFPIRISIISNVRFLRESLAEVLPREGTLSISGLFPNLQEALFLIVDNQPDIVLLDEALPGGLTAVGQIRGVAPQTRVVVIAVAETAEEVIAWAEAGAAGYVPLLVDIRRGGQPCPPSVVAGLLRQLSNVASANSGNRNMTSQLTLTRREAQIAQMIVAGMSNKDIARNLNIGVATAKTHVHHLLGKLNLQRRGQAASWVSAHRTVTGTFSDSGSWHNQSNSPVP
jgi:two-component system, NarL family, nitrate/nitrite response regulator NarL